MFEYVMLYGVIDLDSVGVGVPKPKKTMTDEDWKRVFKLRCRSKRGETISEEEQEFLYKAFMEDEHRYSDLNRLVFEETKPFGSTAEYRG